MTDAAQAPSLRTEAGKRLAEALYGWIVESSPNVGEATLRYVDEMVAAVEAEAAAPSEPPALDPRWVAAINAHMADFLDQPESFDNPEAIGVNLARHYRAAPEGEPT